MGESGHLVPIWGSRDPMVGLGKNGPKMEPPMASQWGPGPPKGVNLGQNDPGGSLGWGEKGEIFDLLPGGPVGSGTTQDAIWGGFMSFERNRTPSGGSRDPMASAQKWV